MDTEGNETHCIIDTEENETHCMDNEERWIGDGGGREGGGWERKGPHRAN